MASTLLNDIVAFWRLSETSGTRYDELDQTDLADVNTVGNRAGPDAVGALAADFVRANSEMLRDVGNSSCSFAGHQSFTIAGWFLADELTYNHGLVSKWSDLAANRLEYNLFHNAGATNRFRFAVRSADDTQSYTVTDSTVVVVGTWYFVVAWHDADEDTINIQVDNGVVNTLSWNNGVYGNDNDLEIGHYRISNDQYHDGGAAAVGIWSRVLTETEKTTLYEGSQYPFTDDPATFLVQDDDGSVDDANSYLEVSEFKTYHKVRGNDYSASLSEIQEALVRATDYLDSRFRFVGTPKNGSQRTAWPRLSARDRDGNYRSDVPHEVKDACADYALLALTQSLNPTPDRDDTGRAILKKFEKVGPIEESTEYAGGATYEMPKYPVADNKLKVSGLVVSSRVLRRA